LIKPKTHHTNNKNSKDLKTPIPNHSDESI